MQMRTISPQALLHLVAQACAVAALGLSTSYALADAVFVTPGSLSGYTYYPPVKAGGGGGSGNASGRVETLQKCYVAIKSPDVSFSLQAAEFYGLENIRLYYKAAGGNGGTGTNGGGGGSTAIILNGSTAVIAPGGNGGQEAPVTKGDFQVAPGDSVRIVTGGGGGSGWPGVSGGGGGAGWRGGGAGSSYAPGQGGSAMPGAGGGGANPGTSGSGHNGGVSTYPDGSSAPIGDTTRSPAFWQRPIHQWAEGTPESMRPAKWWMYLDARIPATPMRSGSNGLSFPLDVNAEANDSMVPGFGGAWGRAGSPAPRTTWGGSWGYEERLNGTPVQASNDQLTVPKCGGYNCSFTTNYYQLSHVGSYADPTEFQLTRKPTLRSYEYGTDYEEKSNLPGQVIFMYSAVECSLLK